MIDRLTMKNSHSSRSRRKRARRRNLRLQATAPLLHGGWGNPSRGDLALVRSAIRRRWNVRPLLQRILPAVIARNVESLPARRLIATAETLITMERDNRRTREPLSDAEVQQFLRDVEWCAAASGAGVSDLLSLLPAELKSLLPAPTCGAGAVPVSV